MRTILIDVLNSAELNGERHILQREEHFTNDIDARGTTRYMWRDTDGAPRFACSTWEDAQIVMDRSRTMQTHTAVPEYQHHICALAQSQRRWYRLEKVADEYLWFGLRGESLPSLGMRYRHTSIAEAISAMRRVQEDERTAAAQERIFGDAPTPPVEGEPAGFAPTHWRDVPTPATEDFGAREYRGEYRWQTHQTREFPHTPPRPEPAPTSPSSLILDVLAYRNLRGELLMLHREAPVTDPANIYCTWRMCNGTIWCGYEWGGRPKYSNQREALLVMDAACDAGGQDLVDNLPPEQRSIRAVARCSGGRWHRLQLLDDVEQFGWARADTAQTDYIGRPFNTISQAIEYMRNRQVREHEEDRADETVWGDWPTPEGVLYNESLLRRAERANPTNRPPVYPPAQTQAPMHTKNVNKP